MYEPALFVFSSVTISLGNAESCVPWKLSFTFRSNAVTGNGHQRLQQLKAPGKSLFASDVSIKHILQHLV